MAGIELNWVISPIGDLVVFGGGTLLVIYIAQVVIVRPRRRRHADALLAARRRTYDSVNDIASTLSPAPGNPRRSALDAYLADLARQISFRTRCAAVTQA